MKCFKKEHIKVPVSISSSFSTCSKFTEGVARVACGLLQLKKSPSIIHQVLLVLRVHGIHLPVFAALVKQWTQKKLSKPAKKKKMAITSIIEIQLECCNQLFDNFQLWIKQVLQGVDEPRRVAGHHKEDKMKTICMNGTQLLAATATQMRQQ